MSCNFIATILIVEDDLSITRLMKLLLEGYGHRVVGTAQNGQMAIDLFKSLSEKPNIVIMDYRMPIKNGLEVTSEILQISNHTKIIFTTADEEIKEQALKVGAFSVINKPFDFKELILRIDEAFY
jgi:two-component system chemotaxis response regulator CheY